MPASRDPVEGGGGGDFLNNRPACRPEESPGVRGPRLENRTGFERPAFLPAPRLPQDAREIVPG